MIGQQVCLLIYDKTVRLSLVVWLNPFGVMLCALDYPRAAIIIWPIEYK